jgi:hypothetical protein
MIQGHTPHATRYSLQGNSVCILKSNFDIFCSSPDVNPPVHYFGPTEILYISFHVPYMPVI